jgi:hypothetical protein
MSDREPEVPALPNRWQESQADAIYGSAAGRLVSFSEIVRLVGWVEARNPTPERVTLLPTIL